ncbi:MAG: retropepsin-like aspartic protease [Candidatus Odinarchaeota archaeon]
MNIDFKLDETTRLVEIPVMLNGKGPYAFHLDIGASKVMIREELVELAGIEIIDNEIVEAKTASKPVPTRIGMVRELSLGSETVTNQQVGVPNFQNLARWGGKNGINGVIGHNFLKNYRLEVSYPRKKLSLTKGEELSKTAGDDGLVPFEYLDGDTHLVTINVNIDDKGSFPFILDTGAGGSIINTDLAKHLQLPLETSEIKAKSPAGLIDTHVAKIKEFKIPFKTYTNMSLIAIPLSHLAKNKNPVLGGIIGFDILKDFDLIIDYPNKRVGLARR